MWTFFLIIENIWLSPGISVKVILDISSLLFFLSVSPVRLLFLRRSQGIPIAIFFDDGVGASSSLEVAKVNSSLVCSGLSRCGFEINHEKSSWEPMNKFSWIGYNIDTHTGFNFASDSRIEKLCSDLNGVCANLQQSAFVHVKAIASTVGQIISMTSRCRNVTQIMTRFLHLIINSRHAWNSFVFVQDQGKKSFTFGETI